MPKHKHPREAKSETALSETVRAQFPSTAFVIAVIVLLGLVAYANTFDSPFQFDDGLSIVNENAIQSFQSVRALWQQHQTRFLTYFTFYLNYLAGQTDVRGYHAVNLAIHVLTSLCLFALVRLLLTALTLTESARQENRSREIAFVAALIFLTHPIQTQAVTYLSQRAASLAAGCYVAAMALYARGRLKRSSSTLALAFCVTVAAMFTKETAFTLPAALLLMEFFCFGGNETIGRRLLRLGPFLVTLAIIPALYLARSAADETLVELARETARIPRAHYLLTQLNVIRTYFRLLFLPIRQNLDYDYPISVTLAEPGTFASFLWIVAVAGAAWSIRRKRSLIAFGVFLFFLALSVESTFIPIRDVIFEHRLYLPMAGFSMALAVGIFRVLADRSIRNTCLGMVIALATFATYQRNEIWRDPVTLWSDTARKSPAKARPHNNLGIALAERGRYAEAIREFQTALAIHPQDMKTLLNLGLALELGGSWEKALEAYGTLVHLAPKDAEAKHKMALLLHRRNRTAEAIGLYREALQLDPDNGRLHSDFGGTLLAAGTLDEAAQNFLEAIRLSPSDPFAHNNMGVVLLRQGRHAEALEYFEQALRLKPGYAEAQRNRLLALKAPESH
jgi:Flp pilus assembly protein TadD